MKVVYVSVDPRRDTPSVLKADLGNFDLDAVGLTGTRQEIDRAIPPPSTCSTSAARSWRRSLTRPT
ncbi:MAG: SCO family protein [Gemmatimonadales bacterium]|nr:SCO family protein [Gemmatimonadales bacterium]